MTSERLTPVQLPLDPAKTHLYRTRDGSIVKEITIVNEITNNDRPIFLYKVTVLNKNNEYIYYVTKNGIQHANVLWSPYDITHEIYQGKHIFDESIRIKSFKSCMLTLADCLGQALSDMTDVRDGLVNAEYLDKTILRIEETLRDALVVKSNDELIIGKKYNYRVTNTTHIQAWRSGILISFTDKNAVIQKDNGDYKVLQRNYVEMRLTN